MALNLLRSLLHKQASTLTSLAGLGTAVHRMRIQRCVRERPPALLWLVSPRIHEYREKEEAIASTPKIMYYWTFSGCSQLAYMQLNQHWGKQDR